MEAFVNFIKEYGSTIIAALSVIVGIIAVFVKKRPKTIEDFNYCLYQVVSKIPEMVSDQELRYGSGHGDEKKTAVLVEATRFLSRALGRELSPVEADISLSEFSHQVEGVLETPQKKGVE